MPFQKYQGPPIVVRFTYNRNRRKYQRSQNHPKGQWQSNFIALIFESLYSSLRPISVGLFQDEKIVYQI